MNRIEELKKELNALEYSWDTEVGPWYHYTLDGAEYMDEDAPGFILDLDREIYDRLADIQTEIDMLEEADEEARNAINFNNLALYLELCGMDVELVEGPRWWEIRFRDGGMERFYSNSDMLEWVRNALWYMWEAYRDQGEVDEWSAAVERVKEAR